MHHLSLFPRIVSTREVYVLTSHADSPLRVWDIRHKHRLHLTLMLQPGCAEHFPEVKIAELSVAATTQEHEHACV